MPRTDAIPSLMDDVEFLAALDTLDGEPALEEAIPRDVNRWFLEASPSVEAPARIHRRPAPPARTFVVVFVGASAGAFAAMLLFYDRLQQILELWSR